MKAFILLLSLLISVSLHGQISWITDYNVARAMCKESGKLMVIDFWADWCAPCKTMEKKLWSNSHGLFNDQNFVALKIDVTKDAETPERFEVTGIPKVVVAMADGTVIWEKVGFSYAESFIGVLNSIPADVSGLYKCFYNINALTKDSKCAYDIAVEFQKLAANTPDKELRSALIYKNIEYFKKARKFNNAPELEQDVELHLLLNEVYSSKAKKAIKKFNKSFGSAENCRNKELAHFLLAHCYNQMNDNEKYLEEIKFISDNNLLNQLEQANLSK